MKRLIGITISFCIIVGIITWEIIISRQYIEDIQKLSTEIKTQFDESNYSGAEAMKKVEELSSTWKHHENILCLLANHKDIEELGEQITRIQTAQENKNHELFQEGLNLIIFYADGYTHIFGITVQNII